MKSEEKGLTVCSFIFGMIAVMMIVMDYILPLLLHVWRGNNATRGVMGLPTPFWMAMSAFGYFSWVASVVFIAVNLVYNRIGIKTTLGRIGMGLNVVCFLYYVYVTYMIVRFFIKMGGQ